MIRFTRGASFYQIAPAYVGVGYVGICDGRVVARAMDRAMVALALIEGEVSATVPSNEPATDTARQDQDR